MPSNQELVKPPLKPVHSATDASRLRGRTRQVRYITSTNGNLGLQQGLPSNVSNPASWIRSASTSSLRKLKRSPANHSPARFGHIASSTNLNTFMSSGTHSDMLITKVNPSSPSLSPVRTRGISLEPTHRENGAGTLIDQEIQEEGSEDMIISSDDVEDDVVLDVLPSFELYNTLHRHIPQGNVNPDIHELPPSYGEAASNHCNGFSTTRNSSSSNLNSSGLQTPGLLVTSDSTSSIGGNNITNDLVPMHTQQYRINYSRSSSTINDIGGDSDAIGIEDDLNENENVFVDKLYTLPKMNNSVEIEIRVTKHASLPPLKPENESMLKEYTSGDAVHGYCVIENKSSQPVKFEMLYVTLEGYISVVDKQKGKRTIKRFLRMVDLSASWSYTNIELGTGLKYKSRGVDSDNSILGLNNDRILEPGVRHKKFFVFKFPSQLLDTTCKHELFSHCLLPPSLGVDKYKDHCKYATIEINNALGCGHLATKGSPIVTYDMAGNDLSVNYTVDARIVGKDPKTQKLGLMREREYNVRFVPFGFHSTLVGERSPSSQLQDLKALIEKRLDILKTIFKRLQHDDIIKNSDLHGTEVADTVNEDAELDSDEILARKLRQLNIDNRAGSGSDTRSSSVFDDIKKCEPEQDIIESELKYRIKNKPSSKISLFSGFLSSGSHSNSSSTNSSTSSLTSLAGQSTEKLRKADKSGLILLSSSIPIKSLPYYSPSIIRKTNSIDQKSKHFQENWVKMLESLPVEEREKLTSLKLHLSCLQSNNSIEHDPPEIQAITTELIALTVKSENSIPIKLSSQMLIDSAKVTSMNNIFRKYIAQIDDFRDKFEENKDKINELYNKHRDLNSAIELKFSDFISTQLYNNIESLAHLNVKVDTMGEVFKKQLSTLKEKEHYSSGLGLSSKYGNSKISLSSSTSNGSRSKTYSTSKGSEEIFGRWIKKSDSHYEREVNVRLEYTNNLILTLVPSFESCICSRFYCVRVTIKFHHVGSSSIDIPVTIKHF